VFFIHPCTYSILHYHRVLTYLRSRGKETLPATFLLNSFLSKSKLAPLTNYITDSDAELNDETESVTCNLSGGQVLIKRNSKEMWREVFLVPRLLWYERPGDKKHRGIRNTN